MTVASTDPPDRFLFTRMVAHAASERDRPLPQALGLAPLEFSRLADRHLPEWRALATRLLAAPDAAASASDAAPEETDLRALLLAHRAGVRPEEVWAAAIIARRSIEPNHLWQDLGLANRDDLQLMMRRYFPVLKERNSGDMKWKKFLYRQLCESDGLLLCRSPTCDACTDYLECFGPE